MVDAANESWASSPGWERAQAAAEKHRNRTVLMLGSGFHRQAGTGWLVVDWPSLVGWRDNERAHAPAPPAGVALPLAWEGGADDRDGVVAAADQEAAHLKRIADRLGHLYRRGGERNPWVRKVRGARLEDMIVFNFDLTFADEKGEPVPAGTNRSPDVVNEGATRVWYPHGHIDDPPGIVLGTRRYGLELQRLENARAEFWRRRRQDANGGASDDEPEHWLDLVLSNRPLFMIGLGLCPDEWTIWWALTQRARRFLRKPADERPATIAFVYDDRRTGTDCPDFGGTDWLSAATKALGVDVVRFARADASQVWERVLASVTAVDPPEQRR